MKLNKNFLLLSYLVFCSSALVYGQTEEPCFTLENSRGCVPFTVQAIDCSGSQTDLYSFDGEVFIASNTFTYQEAGNYMVIQAIQGTSGTIRDTLYVEAFDSKEPELDITLLDNRQISINGLDTFYDSLIIDFGDGTISTIKTSTSIMHQYENIGEYTLDIQGLFIGSTANSCQNKEINLYVSNAPLVQFPIVDQITNEDEVFSFQFPENTFIDNDEGETITYTATQEDLSDLPSWLSFQSENRTFSGTPLNDDVGILNIKVTATDNYGFSVSDFFQIEVINVNNAPEISPITLDLFCPESTFSIDLLDYTTDIDHDILTDISFSQTNNKTEGFEVILDQSILTITHNATSSGSFIISITAEDIAGGKTTSEITIDAAFLQAEIIRENEDSNILTATEAESYQWKLDGVNISPNNGGAERSIRASAVGNYIVEISYNGKCKATSEPLFIDQFTSIEKSSNLNELIISPNPAQSFIRLTSPRVIFTDDLSIKIFSLTGQTMYQAKNWQDEIDISRFRRGIYFLMIQSDGHPIIYQKFIKN